MMVPVDRHFMIKEIQKPGVKAKINSSINEIDSKIKPAEINNSIF